MASAPPGQANGARVDGFVEDTRSLPERGFYDTPIDVTITTSTPGAVIRCTLDGSVPTETHGIPYAGPIRIAKTAVVRAAAFKPGFIPTSVDTQTYIFLGDVITSSVMKTAITKDAVYGPQMRAALTDVPTISLVTPAGVLDQATKDVDYPEVPTSIEWLNPDGSPGFQENAGAAHFGGRWPSTNFAKKSFRIYFRGEYGATKLTFPVFAGYDRGLRPVEVFDQLELHAGHHDMSQRGFYMSASLTDDTMLDMGDLNPHGRFVHLYLNGVYWGLYHLRERWNAGMHAQYLGGDKEDYEAIKPHVNMGGWADLGVPYDGDGSAWLRTMSLRNGYEGIKPYLDVQNYVDFMLMYMFGNSEAEFRCVGPVDAGSGFKMWLNDADGFTRSASNRASGSANIDGPGSIFISLFREGDSDYLAFLADRIHEHLFNGGALTKEKMAARLMERCDQFQQPFLAESARWGYLTPSQWQQKRDDYINGVLPSRPAAAVSEFRAAGFYPKTDAPEFNQHGGNVPSGFQLTMTAPGGTVYYTVDGTDPRLPGGAVSPAARVFGTPTAGPQTVVLVGADSGVRAHVPTDGADGTAWTQVGFDDTSWLAASHGAGVGYDAETTYIQYIGLSVDAPMRGINTSVYIRYAFQVTDPSKVTGLELSMRYDDGYVAYLNGQVIASRNTPSVLSWNCGAPAGHSDSDAVVFETATISYPTPLALLRAGANVLAIHGLNYQLTSTDMLIEPQLKAALAPTAGGSGKLSITDATVVKARARNGSEWSALTEAFFTVGGAGAIVPGDLVVSELNYHPPDPNNTEFVEMMNVSTHAINLLGVRFTDGIDFAFPDNRDTILAPGDRIVLVANEFEFQKRYGVGIPVAGIYAGNLNNDGEPLEVRGPTGAVLIHFAYADTAPWPQTPDGEGYTLVLAEPRFDIDLNDPANWQPGLTPGGTPGAGN